MLVNRTEQYIRTHFADEAEIERVVQDFAEQLFGESIVYLSQARIQTVGGRGTVPDAVVIDVVSEEWYVVEAERAIHGTWEHIAPQVSRQLAAVGSPETRNAILQLALGAIRQDASLVEIFRELGVGELEIHGRLERILGRRPTIAIPIDGIPRDLREWVQTLRNDVKLWVLEKYVSVDDPTRVLYSLPDENLPTLSTTQSGDSGTATVRATSSRPYEELLERMPELVGQRVFLDYGPRGGQRRTFEGVLRPDGVEVDGRVLSLSYGAVHCMHQAGSPRQTANGWIMWRTAAGETMSDIYDRLHLAEERPPTSSALG